MSRAAIHSAAIHSAAIHSAAMDGATADRALSIRHAYLEGVDEDALQRHINEFVEVLRSHSGLLLALERPRPSGELRVAKLLYELPIDRH